MPRSFTHLTLDERRLLARLRNAAVPISRTAERLGRHASTIYRELKRNHFAVVANDYDNPEALSFQGAPAFARHVGRRPGFVDEDEAVRVEIELSVEPLLSPLQDVGSILLGGVCRLF